MKREDVELIGIIIIFSIPVVLFLLVEKQNRNWEESKKLNNVESYDEYIAKYPLGKYYPEALELWEELLWSDSQKLNSIESYSKYLKYYPDGKYCKEAKIKKTKLNLK